MKKLFKILICLCLCVVAFGFTACSKDSKISAPSNDAPVYSNGGAVVRKGNYLYFANGYYSIDDITSKNDLDKKYSVGGLYVANVDDEGFLNKTDDVVNTDRLSSRLAGFEATDLHVYGGYLYFTSINTEETKNGSMQKEHLEIYRTKLDGSSLKRIYRSGVDFEDSEGNRVVEFNYFVCDNNVYILIRENSNLKRIKCEGSSIGDVVTISSNVNDVVVPESDVAYGDVYFSEVDDSIYSLTRYNILENSKQTKVLSSNIKIDSLFASKFNKLYFYMTVNNGTSYLYRINNTDFANYDIALREKLTAKTYNKIYLLESEQDGILAISSANVEIIDANYPLNTIVVKTNAVTDKLYSATIMKVQSGYVYYYADSKISSWNYETDIVTTLYTETNTICNYSFDIVGNDLYYFATVGENDYLFRISVTGSSEAKPEIVGCYTSGDKPSEPSEASD